ncbi:MAG: histidine phosphatase family protein [Deltaproteobacteria bacterium]|nr:histidine phosphatase family protein [Deltaproteobacteria bacterium]
MKINTVARTTRKTGVLENCFTGWTDVDLSERGLIQARQAGNRLKSEGFIPSKRRNNPRCS